MITRRTPVPARLVRKGRRKLRNKSKRSRLRRKLRAKYAKPFRKTVVVRTEGYEQGYASGLAEGAEKLLADHLPGDVIIPEITAAEAITAGVNTLRSRGYPLLNPLQVYDELNAALLEHRPYAFIRLGDGELLTLSQEIVLPIEEVREIGHFLPYAGIQVPDLRARDELAACVRVASLVGVPMSRHPHFQPLLFQVLRAHGIRFGGIRYTTSTTNYTLHEQGLLQQLMRGRRILLIGNVAHPLANELRQQGYEITGIVSPVNGFQDVGRVVEEACAHTFDLALVSAGIPAIPICVHLAGRTGKVTMDFGHLANRIAGLAQFP